MAGRTAGDRGALGCWTFLGLFALPSVTSAGVASGTWMFHDIPDIGPVASWDLRGIVSGLRCKSLGWAGVVSSAGMDDEGPG